MKNVKVNMEVDRKNSHKYNTWKLIISRIVTNDL